MKRLMGGIVMMAFIVAPALAEKRDLTPMPKVAAGSVPIGGVYRALIIGIDKHQDRQIPTLSTAAKDAASVRDLLVGRYGFKPEHVKTLFNEQATRVAVEGAMYALGQEARPDDSVLIYYAGHGQTDTEKVRGWWVPFDAKAGEPATFIKNASIRDEIAAMKAKHVYLVADSCFSGTLFAQSRSMPAFNDKFFDRLYQNKSRWGLTSGMNEPVADAGKGGHSIFAYFFLKVLRENEDPYVVPSHIYDQLAPLVGRNAEQQPRSEPLQGAGDEGGQFVFRLATGAVASSPARPSVSESGGGSSDEMARMREELEKLKAEVSKPKAEESKPIEEARVRPPSAPSQTGRELTGKDGAPMVLVPAGEFTMGSTEGDADEKPVHRVSLDAFYMDKYEVTNKLFQKFTRETGYETTAEKEGKAYAVDSSGSWKEVSGANWRKPEGGETVFVSNRDEHPVVSVSWHDAEAYCRWAGKRLPTEAEFEYANRGGTTTTYWWGDGNPGSRLVANIADESAKRQFSGWAIMAGYDDGYVRTAPVGSFAPNPFGLYDTTGNVAEWTADWYGKDYYERSPNRNPTGPSGGEYKVLRGGSWDFTPQLVRSAGRFNGTPMRRPGDIGFRCAKTP